MWGHRFNFEKEFVLESWTRLKIDARPLTIKRIVKEKEQMLSLTEFVTGLLEQLKRHQIWRQL